MTALSSHGPRTAVQRFRRAAVARNTALGAVIAVPAVLIVRAIAVSLTSVSGFQPVALGLSFLPDIALWIHGGQARAATVIPLMIMHIIVAATAYSMLTHSLYQQGDRDRDR